MASKSKRRRRVFRASCILAALIIAGSSFAWFTSQDEVTNRLTANSDYGVSIVESFAPPMNWQPGQEVNKDVYAVNTGNIEAFVKEELSGVLEYSYEYTVDSFDEDCIELGQGVHESIDGATTNEAGGFLAWTNAEGVETGYVNIDKKTGYINSARPEDHVDGRWVPTVAGDYIFRRSIYTEDGATKYTYAGYHFEPGESAEETDDKYYKIVIGNDAFRAAEEIKNADDDGSTRFVFDISVDSDDLGIGANNIGENGVLTTAPAIKYVKVEDVPPTDVSFKYNAGSADKYDGAPYLEVRFNNTQGDQSARTKAVEIALKDLNDAKAELVTAEEAAGPQSHNVAEKEVDYYNALYAYNTAQSRLDKTVADYTYADALVTATNKLFGPAYNRYQAEQKKAQLLQALKDAKDALDTEAATEYTSEVADDNFKSFTEIKNAMLSGDDNIDKDTLVPATIRTAIANSANGYGGGAELANVKDNLAALDSIWKQIAGADEDGSGGILKEIADDYDNFINAADPTGNKETDLKPGTLSNTDPKGYYQLLLEDLDRLETLLTAYASTYTTFAATLNETHLTGLENVEESLKTKIETYYKNENSTESGSVQDLENRVKNDAALSGTNTVRGLNGRIADYAAAYNAYYTYMEEEPFTGVTNPTWSDRYYQGVKDWNTAVENYNIEVSGAKTTYDTAISKVQPTKNMAIDDTTITDDSGKWTLVNDGVALVNKYSAHNATQQANGVSAVAAAAGDNHATSSADPQITTDNDKDYMKYLTATTTGEGASATTTYSTGDSLATLVRDSFKQLNADPAGTGAEQTIAQLDSAVNNTSTGTLKLKNDALEAYNNAKTAAEDVMNTLKAAQQKVTAKEKAYNDAVAAQTAQTATQRSNIAIDVVLDKNVVKSDAQTTENATWVFDKDTDQTKTPTFYYNRVVDPGDTTEKLVDKLVFCDTVTSKDYVDLTFDLNVKLDSAQALYDNATHTTIITDAVDANDAFAMKASVAADNDTVTWARAATPAPTPTTTNVDVTVTGADAEHNLIKMVKTGTGDTATWAVADSGSTVVDAASGYYYTVNGAGSYATVADLTAALNAVTGDTTPAVAYVTD